MIVHRRADCRLVTQANDGFCRLSLTNKKKGDAMSVNSHPLDIVQADNQLDLSVVELPGSVYGDCFGTFGCFGCAGGCAGTAGTYGCSDGAADISSFG